MTPKERLKRLESYSVCDNYREKEEDFREIEKALEVLDELEKATDILKAILNKVLIIKFDEDITHSWYVRISKINHEHSIVNIGKEEYELLKELLENE